MTQTDAEKLTGLMPQFRAAIQAGIDQCAKEAMAVLICSGFRNQKQQNDLYAQGRTTPGHIVTNARAGQSMHNYGMAVDLVPYQQGVGSKPNWTVSTPQFQRMVAIFKAHGLAWGGDWQGKLGDFDHFQVGGLPPTPSPAMQLSYQANKGEMLDGIWEQALAGKYLRATPKYPQPVEAANVQSE